MTEGKKLKIPIRAAGVVEEEARLLISAGDLKKRLDSGEKLTLIDVRSELEYKMLHIEGAKLGSRELVEDIFAKWPKDSPIVVCDHFGKDSLSAVRALETRGFTHVKALAGGIDSWSQVVDPMVPRY